MEYALLSLDKKKKVKSLDDSKILDPDVDIPV